MRFFWIWLTAVSTLLTTGVFAYGADDSGLRACAKVSADAERLACYDKLAAEASLQSARSAHEPNAGGPGGTRANASDSAAGAGPTPGAARAGTAAAPGPAPAAVAQSPQAVGTPREFGLPPVPQLPPSQEVKSVTANVTAIHRNASGGVTVDLDNGQRWQQLTSIDMGLEVGDKVTISRAMLGSFWMAPPSGRGSKVRRLQ